MKNHLLTGLYHMDIRTFNSDIAHVYEHLLIQTFEHKLIAQGFSPLLYGWVGGETFRNVVFIEYGLYNPEVERLFAAFMRQHPRIDFALLDNELLRVEAEAKSIVSMPDRNEVINQLLKIDRHTFTSDADTFAPHHHKAEAEQVSPASFVERRSKKSFRDITTIITLPSDSTIEEKMLFLRLKPIVCTAVDIQLFSLGLYATHTTWPISNLKNESFTIYSDYSMRRGHHTLRDIQKIAAESIRAIDITRHGKELQYFIDGFIATPHWRFFPMDYYRHTGLLASMPAIAALLTPQNIQAVIAKLEVKVTGA